jgi:predicted TIM-barrel fold metal-dependent hydrolase
MPLFGERGEPGAAIRYRYISADNHIDLRWLPATLWHDRLPRRLRATGPKVVETPQGSQWEWEGQLRGEAADGSRNAELREHTFAVKGIQTPAGSLPPADARLIVEHFDAMGVYAGVFYGDTRKWAVKDPELRLEIYRAYNDFLLELNQQAPDRLVALPTLPTMHPEACAAEIARVVKHGAKGVEYSVFDADPPVWDPVWDAVWSAAEDAGIPIGCHIGDKSGAPYPPNTHGRSRAHFAVVPMAAAPAIAQLVFSGVLERHPRLHISIAECRVGWVPFLISWMDRQVRERPPDPTVHLSLLPSEYFARQMTVTFEDDLVGARLVPMEWAYLRDSAMWGADYPHTQGLWSNLDHAMEEMFRGVDPLLREEVVFHRAARIFHLHPPVRPVSDPTSGSTAGGVRSA